VSDDVVDLADALAERALARTVAAGAGCAVVLGVLALAFVQLAGGRFDATSAPQVAVLAVGQVAGLVVAWTTSRRLRAVRAARGTGPGHASGAAVGVGRAVVGVPAVGLLVGAAATVALEPRSTAAFSALLAVALLGQLPLLLHLQGRALRRAARPPGYPPPS
jgi:hypothetical protein